MEAGVALGVASLVWDVAKDLYSFFKTISECDGDIEGFRAQLLQLQNIAGQMVAALQRPGLAVEDRAGVEDALDQCTEAAERLRVAVDKIQASNSQAGGFRKHLKRMRGKASYPLKKATIEGLAKNVATCRTACGHAVELLGLNVGATTIENLQRLDDSVTQQFGNLANNLTNLQLTNEANASGVIQILRSQASQAAQQQSNIDEAQTRKVLDRLTHSDLSLRKGKIDQAYGSTLEWMLNVDAPDATQNAALIAFLRCGSGIFWIRGKPGSGKSTFMKFLLQHRTTISLLREWACSDAVLTPSHFLWVAGSELQRSYHGLLQSLLLQVFESDLPMASQIITQQQAQRLRSADTDDFWTTDTLGDCLHAALSRGSKHYCFFIDGLDECQPEAIHPRLISTLETLGALDNVKIVTSSRPWNVFQQKLVDPTCSLTMEMVNRDSIVAYIHDRVGAIAGAHVLADVDWQTVSDLQACGLSHLYDNGLKRYLPIHSESQILVEDIVKRADGVFLWTALVMDSVYERLAAGRSLVELRKHVKDFPAELEAFFQAQVDRIGRTWHSEMLMAFKLATLHDTSDSSFVMLANNFGQDESPLLSPRFPYDMASCSFDATTMQAMWHKTRELLQRCARDLLAVDNDAEAGRYWTTSEHRITFTHRAAFDFLQTPAMKKMIDQATPSHFQDAEFEYALKVAQLKCASVEKPIDEISMLSSLSLIVRSSPSAALIAEAEHAVIYRVSNAPDEVKNGDWFGLFEMCIALAYRGFYGFIALLLHQQTEVFIRATASSSSRSLTWHAVNAWSLLLKLWGNDISKLDGILLGLLLAHGVDPNLASPIDDNSKSLFFLRKYKIKTRKADAWPEPSVSPWTALLGRLQFTEQAICTAAGTPSDAEATSNIPAASSRGKPLERAERFSDPHVQAAIKDFLASGAKLDAEVRVLFDDIFNRAGKYDAFECQPTSAIDILRRYLPEESNGTNWGALLDEYSRPEKQEEIKARREKLVEDLIRKSKLMRERKES